MAKPAKRKTDTAITTAADRSSQRSRAHNRSADVSEQDIARRAYDRYLARGREHGHDVDAWLEAERELREA